MGAKVGARERVGQKTTGGGGAGSGARILIYTRHKQGIFPMARTILSRLLVRLLERVSERASFVAGNGLASELVTSESRGGEDRSSPRTGNVKSALQQGGMHNEPVTLSS